MWTSILIGLVLGMALVSFWDHNFAGKPWFAQTNADETYQFEIAVGSIKLLEEIDTPWGKTTEAKANMRNIQNADGESFIDDGEHNLPFWACDPLQKVLNDIRSGWQTLEFVRTFEMGQNKKGETVEINEAAFGLV